MKAYKVSYQNPQSDGTELVQEFESEGKARFVYACAVEQGKIDPQLHRRSRDGSRWVLDSFTADTGSYNGAGLGI